jgi:NADH-quinone oxidoreductase subunit F
MSEPTDEQLHARWRDAPAPLLPLLHAFHDRDGYLSEHALRGVAKALRIPIADLFGTVTFYHHFAREPGGLHAPRVCTGPVCRMRGADALLDALDGAVPMPCSGRCDEPVPVLRGHDTLVGREAGGLELHPSPLPPPPIEEVRECVFAEIRAEGRARLAGYRRTGGYEALTAALQGTPEELLATVDASGLDRPRRRGLPDRPQVAGGRRSPGHAQDHRVQRGRR